MTLVAEGTPSSLYAIEVKDLEGRRLSETPFSDHLVIGRSNLPLEQTASNLWPGVARGVTTSKVRPRDMPVDPWPSYLQLRDSFSSSIMSDLFEYLIETVGRALESFRVTFLEIIEPVVSQLVGLSNVTSGPQLLDQPSAVSRVRDGRNLHTGLALVDDLRNWFDESIDFVARCCGLSPSTIYNWASNPSVVPRAEKIEHLIRVHSLASTVIADRGMDGLRIWLRQGDPSPIYALRNHAAETIPLLEAQVYNAMPARTTPRRRRKLTRDEQASFMERMIDSDELVDAEAVPQQDHRGSSAR